MSIDILFFFWLKPPFLLLLDEEKGEDLSAGIIKESEIGTSTGTELNNEHSIEGYCNYIDAGLNKC